MNQYQRLKLYIACFFKDLKWKLCADKQIEEFEQSLVPEESVSGAEVKLIEDIIFMDEEEQKEQKPALEPRRTMLFISGRRRRCNFLNAWWYRRAILRNYHWGKQRGFTEYVADPYSPFGLLAMETLGRLKRSGEKLLLYSVHSCHVGQRRSYRLIPGATRNGATAARRLALIVGLLDHQKHQVIDPLPSAPAAVHGPGQSALHSQQRRPLFR